MASQMPRVTIAASLGTVLEWYDFFLYGTAAALIFPTLFFSSNDPATAVLLSFAVYATGFVARPIGGVIAGHLGDRIGRKTTLMLTLILMGLSTALIGVLPTAQQIGTAAPLLLVILRIVQGFAAGGEWGGASLLTLEHASGRRGFWGSLISMSTFIGLLLGNGSFVLLASTLGQDQLLAWGWRIPFLLSLILVGVGIYLRLRVTESPVFDHVAQTDGRAKAPLLEALRRPRNVIAIFLIRIGQNTSFYIVSVFCLSYATTTLHMDRSVTLTALLVGAAAAAVACPFWGMLADRIGYKRIMAGSLVVSALLSAPLFVVLDTKDAALIVIVIVVAIAGVNASADAIQPGFFTTMFGARFRYSGITIGREAGTIIGGGLAPLIAASLLTSTGHWYAVAGWMSFAAIAGLFGVLLAREENQVVEADMDIVAESAEVQ